MHNFNDLNKFLKEFGEQIGEEMLKEAKSRVDIPEEARNPNQFEQYRESLKTKTEVENNVVTIKVYSDLVVSDGSRWDGVPIGAFLEWGTGPMGESSNSYPHGYPYTTYQPWDYHTYRQFYKTGDWGITARPHLYPTLQLYKSKLRKELERKFK